MDMLPAAQAVESLMTEYGSLVFHLIYGLTGDWQESQDLTQATFLRAFTTIDAARRASGVHFQAKAWLLCIARNLVRMQRRRQRLIRFLPFSSLRAVQQDEREAERETVHALPVQPAGYGMGAVADPAEIIAERDAVRRTLIQLPQTLRTCLLLSAVGGCSTAELAALLALSQAAARQRLARARKRFRALYVQESGEARAGVTVPALNGLCRSTGANRRPTEEARSLDRTSAALLPALA